MKIREFQPFKFDGHQEKVAKHIRKLISESDKAREFFASFEL